MQNSFCPTWFQGLAARNHPARVRSHCLLRFSVLYFAAFTAGVLLCRHTFLGDSAALRSLGEAVLRAPFAGCRYARDYVRAVLHTARWDWGILALIALSGYTFVSRTLSNAALTVHALLFGALSHTLLRALSAGDIAPASGNLAFFLYFFAPCNTQKKADLYRQKKKPPCEDVPPPKKLSREKTIASSNRAMQFAPNFKKAKEPEQ